MARSTPPFRRVQRCLSNMLHRFVEPGEELDEAIARNAAAHDNLKESLLSIMEARISLTLLEDQRTKGNDNDGK